LAEIAVSAASTRTMNAVRFMREARRYQSNSSVGRSAAVSEYRAGCGLVR
jgi:hypothetical protein